MASLERWTGLLATASQQLVRDGLVRQGATRVGAVGRDGLTVAGRLCEADAARHDRLEDLTAEMTPDLRR